MIMTGRYDMRGACQCIGRERDDIEVYYLVIVLPFV